MTRTVKILLKILLGGNLDQNELKKYLNLDLKYIKKNLSLLNKYLASNDLGTINKNNNIYSIENKNDDFSKLFLNSDILSKEERVDIICLKLLLDKEIKLEILREKLNVSRSTINSDLKKVKDYLEKFDIYFESRSYKGVFLKTPESSKIKDILCEKIMKLFIKREFLSSYEKDILNKINILNEKDYYELYLKIGCEFQFRKSIYMFYAIYSMALVEKWNDNFSYQIHNLNSQDESYSIFGKIDEIIIKYDFKLDISLEFKIFMTDIVLKIRKYPLFEEELAKSFQDFISKLEKDFDLVLKDEQGFISEIMYLYTIGYLNNKYDFLWIRPKVESIAYTKFGDYLQMTFKELGIEMFYSDILGLAEEIINYFVIKEYSNNFKILYVTTNDNLKYY
ncbi:MAG: helix-turn-helix domain-containing protein, partial [Cetobacterium sp.]